MHGYKKKLLDRYPETKEEARPEVSTPPAVSSLPPVTEKVKTEKTVTPKKSTFSAAQDWRREFQAELEKDNVRFKQEIQEQRKYLLKKVSLFVGMSFFAALLGVGAGAYWMKSQFGPNWNQEMAEFHKQASLKLDRFLNSNEMQSSIEEQVRKHGIETAEKQIETIASSAVYPVAGKMEAGMRKLEADSEAVLARFQSLSDFMLLELRAKNDDRKAFEEILAISRDRDHPYREIASQAVSQIFILVTSLNVQDSSLPEAAEPGAPAFNSFDQFRSVYRDALPLKQPRLLSEMWYHSGFKEEQKIVFLLDVIRSDNSLRALAWACRLLDEKAKIYKPFTAYDLYLEWGGRYSLRN